MTRSSSRKTSDRSRGWRRLLAGHPWFRHAGGYPLPAYSEFMPPPRVGQKPCGEPDEFLFAPDDDFGWRVAEHEERLELRPGLEHIAHELLCAMQRLGRRDPAHGIAGDKLAGNPYWPAELQETGAPDHEKYVLITSLALSRTQDDKGRVRWTLFGGSERGPAFSFWRGFFFDPAGEVADGGEFPARLLRRAYGERNDAAFRVFGAGDDCPKWVRSYAWQPDRPLRRVRYMLTFEPFSKLPVQVQTAYRSGDLHLIPFPGSLLFWGSPAYAALQRELPMAMQIPLLHSMARRESVGGIRVPQSGWLHEPSATDPSPHPERGPFVQHFQRTHRWSKVRRDEDELAAVAPSEDGVAHVLFSTAEDDLGLYGKPMARNAQIWTARHHLLLDGPRASAEELHAAAERVRAGGSFGYRFFYPPMQAGVHQVFWHRPLVAFPADDGRTARVMFDAPAGVLTASGIELWPRIHDGAPASAGKPDRLKPGLPEPLTYGFTAKRSFEKSYWTTIKRLAMGRYRNKDNADCALDSKTQRRLQHHRRDLDALGDFLLAHHQSHGADACVLPFQWKTDFPFDWSEGWLRNQRAPVERDIVVMIPGRDRKRAVIMADHYDTAYMEDVYGYGRGRRGPRLAARGADDNHSATAALMLAAPIFLELSRARRLACDIWLVHLTGEEFPSDCLGARALAQRIVEGNLALEHRGRRIDVSNIEIAGVFVLDMIAHNNDKHRDIFQISPGEGSAAIRLARHAAEAARQWNALAPSWNAKSHRRGRGRRSTDGSLPAVSEHPSLRGEIRLHADPASALYNTDAQIFSDAGLPAVLFMENYDINRHGYHDSHDTMENIDLDYGSALAAMAIETVARVAAMPL